MRKFWQIFLLLAIFVLAGCGGGQSGSKVLRVGSSIDFAPFEFQSESSTDYQGFDMDLIRSLGKEMGYDSVEIQNLPFDGLIPALQGKQIDLAISGISVTPERGEKVLFSDPYYKSGLTIVLRKDNTEINSFKDLVGHKVAVQVGSTSAETVKSMTGVSVTEFNLVPECFLELKAGGVDAVVNDRPVNDYFLKETGEVTLKALPERLAASDYAIAMAKDNTELQKKVNDALAKLNDNGAYKQIFTKWFGEGK